MKYLISFLLALFGMICVASGPVIAQDGDDDDGARNAIVVQSIADLAMDVSKSPPVLAVLRDQPPIETQVILYNSIYSFSVIESKAIPRKAWLVKHRKC